MPIEMVDGTKPLYIPDPNESSLVIPEGIMMIGVRMFLSKTNLKSITLPTTLKRIRASAFEKSGLESIILPTGLKSIEQFAFSKCKNLKQIYFPYSLTEIGMDAFEGTTWLENYDGDFVIVNGMLVKYLGKEETVIVPHCVHKICDGAFMGCRTVKSVTIPKGVTYLGYKCFSFCTSLESVSLPDGLKKIGGYAFENCIKLMEVNVPYGITTIEDHVFGFCRMLDEIFLPESITEIQERAFMGCSSLKHITIPSKVTVIKHNTFSSCVSLEYIYIPDNITKIESDGFSNCYNLKTVRLSSNVQELPAYAFFGAKKINTLHFLGYTIKANSIDMRRFQPNVVREMIETSDYSLKMDCCVKYSIAIQSFLESSQNEAEAYIRKNYSKIMRFLIDTDNYDSIKQLFECGKFAAKRTTEKLLDYAIAHTQENSDPQIQLFIAEYKARNYPSVKLFDDLSL